jgi:hypothetical protein
MYKSGHAHTAHATCAGNRPKGASNWLTRIVIRSSSRAGMLVVCLYFLERLESRLVRFRLRSELAVEPNGLGG